MRVTVIPEDLTIIVNKEALKFPFTTPGGVRAIQWQDARGHIEYNTGEPNRTLIVADYQTEIAPYVDLWQKEKDRVDEENKPKPPTEAEQYNAERAAIDQEFNGIPYGRVTMVKETLNAAILRGKDEAIPYLREQLELSIQAEAESVAALEDKYNVYG